MSHTSTQTHSFITLSQPSFPWHGSRRKCNEGPFFVFLPVLRSARLSPTSRDLLSCLLSPSSIRFFIYAVLTLPHISISFSSLPGMSDWIRQNFRMFNNAVWKMYPPKNQLTVTLWFISWCMKGVTRLWFPRELASCDLQQRHHNDKTVPSAYCLYWPTTPKRHIETSIIWGPTRRYQHITSTFDWAKPCIKATDPDLTQYWCVADRAS